MSTFGTVHFKDGNFFIDVNGKHELIPVNHENAANLKQLAGHKVEVVFSEPKSFIVGLVLADTGLKVIPRVTCYLPAPQLLTAIVDDRARVNLARQMLDDKIISREAFEKIVGPEGGREAKV